jgi:hypothetical protein
MILRNSRRNFAVALLVFTPFMACANPISLNGSSLIAFTIVAFWAFVLESGIVALLLTFRGMAPVKIFGAYFLANILIFFLIFQPLLNREWLPIPLLELLVVSLDGLAIKLLGCIEPLQGDAFVGVSWLRSFLISTFGNAASYFVGCIASHKPWIAS